MRVNLLDTRKRDDRRTFLPVPLSHSTNASQEVVPMLTTALSNGFLLESAKGQLGYKPTAQVSLNDVDGLPSHQRCLSEQLVLMTSIPRLILCYIDVDRITRFLRNTLKN